MHVCLRACECACECACLRVSVRVCARACVSVGGQTIGPIMAKFGTHNITRVDLGMFRTYTKWPNMWPGREGGSWDQSPKRVLGRAVRLPTKDRLLNCKGEIQLELSRMGSLLRRDMLFILHIYYLRPATNNVQFTFNPGNIMRIVSI